MLTDVAFEELQESVELAAEAMLFGLADMLTFGSWCTVMATLSSAVPPEPVTVMVYVVVTAGETVVEPFTATLPMPWSMLAEAASVEVQVSVADAPSVISVESADMVTVGTGYTVTVTLSVAEPYAFVAVMV